MAKKRPLIGLSACRLPPDPERTVYDGRPLLFSEQSMADWLLRAEMLPVVVPYPSANTDDIEFDAHAFVSRVDALVLQGGADVSPTSYGEQPMRDEWSGDATRDKFELQLIHAALDLGQPILAICRGQQILNVALGGTLYQDIETQVPASLRHRNADIYEKNFHDVTIVPNSWLESVYDGAHRERINSVHHQAIKDLGKDLIVQARSSHDDIIEAVKLDAAQFVVGVQWHPEFQDPADTSLLSTRPLTDALREAIDSGT